MAATMRHGGRYQPLDRSNQEGRPTVGIGVHHNRQPFVRVMVWGGAATGRCCSGMTRRSRSADTSDYCLKTTIHSSILSRAA